MRVLNAVAGATKPPLCSLIVVVVAVAVLNAREPCTGVLWTLSSFSHLHEYVEREREIAKDRLQSARMFTHTHTHRNTRVHLVPMEILAGNKHE